MTKKQLKIIFLKRKKKKKFFQRNRFGVFGFMIHSLYD